MAFIFILIDSYNSMVLLSILLFAESKCCSIELYLFNVCNELLFQWFVVSNKFECFSIMVSTTTSSGSVGDLGTSINTVSTPVKYSVLAANMESVYALKEFTSSIISFFSVPQAKIKVITAIAK